MPPLPGILPQVVQSQSPPQSLMVTTYGATMTTTVAHTATAQTDSAEKEVKIATTCSSSVNAGTKPVTSALNTIPASTSTETVTQNSAVSTGATKTTSVTDTTVTTVATTAAATTTSVASTITTSVTTTATTTCVTASTTSASCNEGSSTNTTNNSDGNKSNDTNSSSDLISSVKSAKPPQIANNAEDKNTSNVEERLTKNDNENESESKENEEDEISSKDLFGRPRQIFLKTVNPHITCNLCKGYLIDATTIVECLHTFCHSCIMQHLRTEQYCPRCEMMINTAKPNIKPDTTLQAIVYKLVPGLYEKELMRKRAFYRNRPEEAKLATPEQRGEDTEHLIFGPTENMSLSLEYADNDQMPESDISGLKTPKYLQCPAIFTVAHLKKFILLKFNIDPRLFSIEIMYKVKTIVLSDHYTLMDVAYIYTWKRDAPMRFFFRVKEAKNVEKRKRKPSDDRTVSALVKDKESVNVSEIRAVESKVEENKKSEEVNEVMEVVKTPKVGKSEQTLNPLRVEPQVVEQKIQENVENKPLNENQIRSGEIKGGTLGVEVTRKRDPGNQRANTPIAASDAKNSFERVSTEVLTSNKGSKLEDTVKECAQVSLNNNEEKGTSDVGTNEKINKKIEDNGRDKDTTSNITTETKVEKLKMTLVAKNKQTKQNSSSESAKSDSSTTSSSLKSGKGNKTPKHNHHSSHHKSSSEQEERKLENIKLKIDLIKQNIVTIIKTTGSENARKEVVKSVKSDKEWKLKMKKEKERDKDEKGAGSGSSSCENSPKMSPGINTGENKHQRFEIKTSPTETKGVVPPITIKAECISPNTKKSPLPLFGIKDLEKEIKKETEDKFDYDKNEEEKSRFLNSFALTPIKACSPPDKNDKRKPSILPVSNVVSQNVSKVPITNLSATNSKGSAGLKRKNKDAHKPPAKKTKIDSLSANSAADVKTKSTKITTNQDQPSISFKLAPYPIGGPTTIIEESNKKKDGQLMPAPTIKSLDALKKNGFKTPKNKSAANKAKQIMPMLNSNQRLAAPPGSLTPHPMIPSGIASSKMSTNLTAPGNRTPITRRYPPILPKSPRANPFAEIPADVNKLFPAPATEIKQIPNGTGKDVKVYGPPIHTTVKTPITPSALPIYQQSNMNLTRNNVKGQNTNNYLNFALHNANKARMTEVPIGCRTPIYAPNSPIYSPNSPQYMPNYNISVQPTYKYTKSGSNSTNYLQNFLGQNKQLSNLFPAPPIKKPPESPTSINNNNNNKPTLLPAASISSEVEIKKIAEDNNLKRPYPFSKSPNATGDNTPEPPEKQTKVQSLLNSCNINIPSSLSITITNEDADASTNNSTNPKHKSPVNNYIEILKLPEQPISPEKKETSKKNTVASKVQTTNEDTKVSSISTTTSTTTSVTSPGIATKAPITKVSSPKLSPQTVSVQNTSVTSTGQNLKPSSTAKQLPSLNPIEKKPIQTEVNLNTPTSPKNKKTPSPEKKTTEKSQKRAQSGHDKKNENGIQNKSNKSSNETVTPSKKFRHILPRTSTTSQGINKTTTTTCAFGTGLVKTTAKLQQPKVACLSSLNKKNSNKNTDEVIDVAPNSPKITIATPESLNAQNAQTSTSSPTSSTTTITRDSSTPAVADMTSFISETMFRAQQQASNNGNNVYLPHLAAAASFNPHFASVNFGYNIQQAYLLEHINRMQKAGHEALAKYMKKLKANNGNATTSPKSSPTNTTKSDSG